MFPILFSRLVFRYFNFSSSYFMYLDAPGFFLGGGERSRRKGSSKVENLKVVDKIRTLVHSSKLFFNSLRRGGGK